MGEEADEAWVAELLLLLLLPLLLAEASESAPAIAPDALEERL